MAHDAALDVEESGEEEMDDEPAVAPMLDEDEDLDIQAMILGEVEGIEIDETEIVIEEGSGESTAEGAEKPIESGSAEVRERGGRFPHRVSRRTRNVVAAADLNDRAGDCDAGDRPSGDRSGAGAQKHADPKVVETRRARGKAASQYLKAAVKVAAETATFRVRIPSKFRFPIF